jgi:hypothetical protein
MIPLEIRQQAWRFGLSLTEYEDRLEEIIEPLLMSALRSHAEHAKTWPGGWVTWKDPIPWQTQLLLDRGLLIVGSPEVGRTSVHITEQGNEKINGATA